MVKRMTVWVVCAALLAVGGTVMASNMGFKFVPNANVAGVDYTISFPLNHNYVDAASVYNDIAASGCVPAKVSRLNINPGGVGRANWTGPFSTNFPITKGTGYIFAVSAPCTSWVVVGSHDPAYAYTFAAAGSDYLSSIPMHTTAVRASDIFNSVPTATKVSRINTNPGGIGRQNWTGPFTTDFLVKVGEAYIVTVGGAGTTWNPAHY